MSSGVNAAALAISIIAVATTVLMWGVDKRGRDRDRAERIADRTERHAERNDVLLDVAWVTRQAAGRSDGRAHYWWRFQLVGGTAFSRVTVNYLHMHHRTDSPEVWEPLHSDLFPLTIGAGQKVYLPGYEPTIADRIVSIRAEWTPDGEALRLLERSVIDQPD